MKSLAVIENEAYGSTGLYKTLEAEGFRVSRIHDRNAALSVADVARWDAVIDVVGDDEEASTSFFQSLKKNLPRLIVIASTDRLDLLHASKEKLTGIDFLVVPFNIKDVLVAAHRIGIKKQETRQPAEFADSIGFGNIIGKSRPMREIYRLIRAVADKNISVLVSGESGTGKELVAQAIHYNSARSEKPFIKMNCAAIPETLIESELFGHERGAFTGAHVRKTGKFELANGGTLFLDEVGDMSLTTQAKVLRVIQEQEFERVGGKDTIKVDVRLIAATHRDLKQEVEQERFREDLFYRLNVINLHISPLRERREDIIILADYFLAKFNRKFGKKIVGFSVEVLKMLVNEEWRGNVRELQNVIESAVALEATDMIQPGSLPFQLNDSRRKRQLHPGRRCGDSPNSSSKENPEEDKTTDIHLSSMDHFRIDVTSKSNASVDDLYLTLLDKGLTLEEVEKGMLQAALKKAEGVQKDAAKLLGIQKGRIQYRMKKFNL